MKMVIAGATGLVGNLVHSNLMSKDGLSILTLTRKESLLKTPHQNKVINWKDWKPEDLQAEVFICCLGTTIKDAGSQEAFKEVDYDYILKFAQAAKLSHASKFILISANGANPDSSIFYNKIKGETETSIKELNLENLAILRPSLLIGNRTKKRRGEQVAQNIMPYFDFLLQGPLKKYQSISAQKVADAITWLALNSWQGTQIIESDQMNCSSFML